MAHTYVITSANRLGDIITVIGTVDGFPVTIYPWFSSVSGLPNTAAVQAFLAPIMLNAAISAGFITPTTTAVPSVTAAGTWSQ